MVGKTVVVTGASGFIAAQLVKLLLERGYTVRGTVRNPDDLAKVGFLLNLPGAKQSLKLYKAQLLDEGAFDSVVEGAHGVFHTASPFTYNIKDPQTELIDPALKGTLNVLRSVAKVHSVKRVVLTSSVASIINGPKSKVGAVVDETWWSDEEFNRQKQLWYVVSKILAEKAAWEFAKEKKIDLVAINPAFVIGTILQPSINTSSEMILDFVSGKTKKIANFARGFVDVQDVAWGHVLAYEKPEAEGRYIMVDKIVHYRSLMDMLRKHYPDYPIPTELAYDPKDETLAYNLSNEKARKLGVNFKSTEEQLKDTVESLKEKKWL